MLTRLYRRIGGEDGVSLVEMLVAFVILGIAMSASANFFMTALFSLHQAESRTKATALANEELENLRLLPWDAVGFYAGDFGVTPPDGTVVLDGVREPTARAPLPLETLDRAGVAFTVRRSILWIQNTQTSNENDYKRLVVSVHWSDRGQQRAISVESLRNPSPHEQPTSDFVLSLFEVAPNRVYINADGTLDATRNATLGLTALTSAKADFVAARYAQRGAATETVEALGSADRWNWVGEVTAAHGRTFPNGDALFTFVATRALPYEQQVIGSTLVRFLQPVAITFATVSPSSVCLTDSSPSTPPIDVNVDIDGLVEEDAVTVTWGGGEVAGSQAAATESGSSLTAQIPAAAFGVGTNTVTITGRRLSDGTTATTTRDVVVAQCP